MIEIDMTAAVAVIAIVSFAACVLLGYRFGRVHGETETARWYERRSKAADICGDAVVRVVECRGDRKEAR